MLREKKEVRYTQTTVLCISTREEAERVVEAAKIYEHKESPVRVEQCLALHDRISITITSEGGQDNRQLVLEMLDNIIKESGVEDLSKKQAPAAAQASLVATAEEGEVAEPEGPREEPESKDKKPSGR